MSSSAPAVPGGREADRPTDAGAAIELRNVSVSYERKPALRGVSLQVPVAERLAVVGPNGAGKSTLIKAIVGLVPLDSGEIRIFGQPIGRIRERVAYVPQRGVIDWDFPVLVRDVVLMGRYARLGWLRWPRREDRERAAGALERMGMSAFADRQIGQLSGGQQQRVFLARALAQEADVLLLDEPFVGVDAATEEAIFELLDAASAEGKTTLVVNHDLATVRRQFDRVLLLNGRVVAYGSPEEAMRPDLLKRTYGGRLTVLDAADQLMVIES